MTYRCTWFGLRLVGLGAALMACGDDGDPPAADAPPTDPPAFLTRASKSSTIAITTDDARVVMVNPERGTVSVFDTATDSRIAEIAVGGEPSAVVIHPDNKTAFVAIRELSKVVRITNLDSASAAVNGEVLVGSEPTGLALVPSGKRLFVAEWAEGRIAVIDTATLTETGAIVEPLHPRGVTVTNNGDTNDDDELVIAPEFYGEPVGVEATDTSRAGRIQVYSAGDLSPRMSIALAPIDSGFAPASPPAPAGLPAVMTSPNQLWVAAVAGTKIYVPSISASPDRPTNFQTNVQPVVYVADLASGAEDRSALGSTNLARLVRDQIQTSPKFFLADLVDVDFVGAEVAYVLSRGADVLQRVVYAGAGPTLGGTAFAPQIDLNVAPAGSPGRCQNPTGIVTAHAGGRAYINCWGTRLLGIVDFSTQSLAKTVMASEIAAAERDVQDGLHFFFTGRGRWSRDAWSSCASCHPDGLSDNITWSFAAGPRQSTSTDGSYSHGSGPQKQRVFNWTGIFDEMHDFERNTRGVQGGKGAITEPDPMIANAQCGNLEQERQVAVSTDGLGRAVKADQDAPGRCTKDFDKIEAYEKTVRPPSGLRKLDAASVERGRILFGEPGANNNAGCVRCHGGAGWTASRRFFTPPSTPADNGPSPLAATPFMPPPTWPPATTDRGWNFHTQTIAPQPASSVFTPPESVQAPTQVACVMRNVGTFGSDTLETRFVAPPGQTPNFTARAQGRLGYNVPSLYGLQVAEPLLHHGNAKTLQDLFDNPAWAAHATAGNPNWLAAGTAADIAGRKADMINFLLSIDATTPEQPIPAGFDGCP